MLYNYSYTYAVNMINVHSAKKTLAFNMVITRKILTLLRVLHKSGVIWSYHFVKPSNLRPKVRIILSYYNNIPLSKRVKLISRPSKSFYISLKALKLMDKKLGNSLFIVSTTEGLITHKEAILHRKGGILIGFFSI